MENRADTAKKMLAALEKFSDHELRVIGIENWVMQMRNIHKILRKAALVEEIWTLAKELSKQCHDYRARFDKCSMLGLPSIFAGSGDIYAEDIYLHHLQSIVKDESALNAITKQVEAKDNNQTLKSCYDILSGLKNAFKSVDQPEYARGAELSLAATTAEEYKYPLGKEWNMLTQCVKVYRQKTEAQKDPDAPQQG